MNNSYDKTIEEAKKLYHHGKGIHEAIYEALDKCMTAEERSKTYSMFSIDEQTLVESIKRKVING